MELPPGWRGYGAKDYTDHPETAARQAEVDAAKEKYGDRFERQRALMPYEHLLAEADSRAQRADRRAVAGACDRSRAGVGVCLGKRVRFWP